jgi:hypothetical protein
LPRTVSHFIGAAAGYEKIVSLENHRGWSAPSS